MKLLTCRGTHDIFPLSRVLVGEGRREGSSANATNLPFWMTPHLNPLPEYDSTELVEVRARESKGDA
jgi:hypothetical protein